MHRSLQTEEEIKAAEVKNTSDLYFNHLNFFSDHLKNNSIVQYPVLLHKNLYPSLTPSNYDIAKNKDLIEKINNIYHVLSKIDKEPKESSVGFHEERLFDFDSVLSEICGKDEAPLLRIAELSVYRYTAETTRIGEERAKKALAQAHVDYEELVDLIKGMP